jgi:hypothetical protein
MKHVLVLLLLAAPAGAYEPATHAGLTEQAALASSLHRRLLEAGRPLGLYEPLALAGHDDELLRRLQHLDPADGYAPEGGKHTALGWLVAGAVLEGVPAARLRNHFFEPTRGAGLDERGGGARALRTRVAAAANGTGSLRGVFTGTNFDGSGLPSLQWLSAERGVNDWGLARFLDERERAATAPTSAERSDAMARALLAAGAIARLVESAGDPAWVRDDYRVELEEQHAPYARFVERRYGRVAVPPPGGAPIARAHLAELVHDGGGTGLADRTHKRFFSTGTLPPTGRWAQPEVEPGDAPTGYVSSADVAHLIGYERNANGVQWRLDARCYGDYAEALLPEIGRFAAGALELLFRGRLDVELKEGTLSARVGEVDLGAGEVTLWGDDAAGARRRIAHRRLGAAIDGEVIVEAERPEWARRVTALYRGVDRDGEPLVVTRELALP